MCIYQLLSVFCYFMLIDPQGPTFLQTTVRIASDHAVKLSEHNHTSSNNDTQTSTHMPTHRIHINESPLSKLAASHHLQAPDNVQTIRSTHNQPYAALSPSATTSGHSIQILTNVNASTRQPKISMPRVRSMIKDKYVSTMDPGAGVFLRF